MPGKVAMDAAMNYAKANGGTILEMTQAGDFGPPQAINDAKAMKSEIYFNCFITGISSC